jgi:hypothetical protein
MHRCGLAHAFISLQHAPPRLFLLSERQKLETLRLKVGSIE